MITGGAMPRQGADETSGLRELSEVCARNLGRADVTCRGHDEAQPRGKSLWGRITNSSMWTASGLSDREQHRLSDVLGALIMISLRTDWALGRAPHREAARRARSWPSIPDIATTSLQQRGVHRCGQCWSPRGPA